jgi:hypothetical protein
MCACAVRLSAQQGSTAPAETLTLERAISEAQVNNRLVKASQQSVLFANEI